MKLNQRPTTITNLVLAALFVLPFGHTSAKSPASTPIREHALQLAAPGFLPVFGDFDGDRRLDQARPHLAGTHQCILVRFGNSLERHLEFGGRAPGSGALLSRDVNHDNKADLIWINQSMTASPVVWLGDGLGHFSMAAEWTADADLGGLLSGENAPAVGGDVSDARVCLSPEPLSSELSRATHLEDQFLNVPVNASRDCCRDPGRLLSYLRKRGPPSSNIAV